MELIFFSFIIFFIIIIFYLLNYSLKKKINNEYFEKLPDGLLCGTKNNVCNIDENGVNSCCEGYVCERPEGNFQYKVCMKPESNYASSGSSGSGSSGSGSDSDSSGSGSGSGSSSNSPIIFPVFHFPSISKPELPSKYNIFSKDFWNTDRMCKINNKS